jgi:UDP-N-acetylglucosamine 2-epimerase
VRPSTERPITCDQGTNRLVAPRRDAILAAIQPAALRRPVIPPRIAHWDGQAAERIATILAGPREEQARSIRTRKEQMVS